jgi:hypothetical protein
MSPQLLALTNTWIPSEIVPATCVGDAAKHTVITDDVPIKVARTASTNGSTITHVEIFDVPQAASRLMIALAQAFDHGWLCHPNNRESFYGVIEPYFAHKTGSGSVTWVVTPSGHFRAEFSDKEQPGDGVQAIIDTTRGFVEVHLAGYHSVWTDREQTWLREAPQGITGKWSVFGEEYQWYLINTVLKAIGSRFTLPGIRPR